MTDKLLISKGLLGRQYLILDNIKNGAWYSSGELLTKLKGLASEATLKRDFTLLIKLRLIEKKGAGRGTHYRVRPESLLLMPINQIQYFEKPQDQRNQNTFAKRVFLPSQ